MNKSMLKVKNNIKMDANTQDYMVHNLSGNFDRLNYSAMPGRVNAKLIDQQSEEKMKLQEEKVKQLQRKLKAYQKNNLEQNKKLSSQDNLVIEYNSLSKNYTELEALLKQYKLENAKLNKIIEGKNSTIEDYQEVIRLSKTKFEQYDEASTALKLKNEENETKLKVLPELLANNAELNQKINGYEARIENLKNQHEKKEELYKVKLANMEKVNKSTIHQYENDISDLKVTIEKLKVENEKLKTLLSDANDRIKDNESEYKKKLLESQKNFEKASKALLNLQNETSEANLSIKERLSSDAKRIAELEEEIKSLNQQLNEKSDQLTQLNTEISEYVNTVNECEKELKKREAMINGYKDEKELLTKKLNDKQIDFVEYQNSSQQENDILHKKLLMMDKERSQLIDNLTSTQEEIKNLQEQISQYETHSKLHLDECKEVDRKYNDLAKTLELKEEEYNSEYERYSNLLKKSQNEIDVLKAKYEKKCQMLKLENDELNLRIKNLISTLISLKDYAMSVERNINDRGNINMNNSMYTASPYTYNMMGDTDNQYSKQLINGMKNMIAKIDSKILYENNKYSNSNYI